jgi:hypothetical protein
VQLKHPDKQVAEYLRRARLSERLDERTIEELQGDGAGPKTVGALRDLAQASQSLPKPAPKVVAKASPIPPPSPEEQDRVLAEARENSINYDKSLPDFICTQVTRRFEDPTGLEFWRAVDTLTARLSYFEGKEDYKLVLVNSHPITNNIAYEQVGGTTTRGEFGTWLKKLFGPKASAAFQWERWATLRGKRTHVFSYRVARRNSEFSISYDGHSVIAGYEGLLYIDRDSLMVTRHTIDAVDVPSDFPIRQVNTVLDYDYVEIAGGRYLLPLRAVARSRTGKALVRNETEFRLYRKFAAEATVTFTPEPLPEEQTQEQPPK